MILWIFLIPVFLIFFAIYFDYWGARSRKEILSKLSDYFNGSVSSTFYSTIFNGKYQGLNFSVEPTPGARGALPYLTISLFKSCTLNLFIYRESALSNIGEKIGLVHGVKVNDEAFDGKFLILSKDSERARIYLNSADIKNTIKEIFNEGFDSLVANKKSITIRKPSYNSTSDLEPQNITNVLQRLSVVMKGL